MGDYGSLQLGVTEKGFTTAGTETQLSAFSYASVSAMVNPLHTCSPRTRHDLFVEAYRGAAHRVEVELALDAEARGAAVAREERGVPEQFVERRRERFGIPRRDGQTGHAVHGDERHAGVERGVYDGLSAGHRFELHDAECLAARDRREREHVGRVV